MDVVSVGTTNAKTYSSDKSPEFVLENRPNLSYDQIRGIRETFEREAAPMQKVLGSTEHHTLLVTMYEGTEQFLNKKVSDFDVTSYLESLKLNAKELHNRGVSLSEFRSSLFRHSQDTVMDLLRQI